MSNAVAPPPAELDSANVLAYAVLDEPHDYLLFYCSFEWEVLGAGGYASLAEAKQSAEVAYAGSCKKWQQVA